MNVYDQPTTKGVLGGRETNHVIPITAIDTESYT